METVPNEPTAEDNIRVSCLTRFLAIVATGGYALLEPKGVVADEQTPPSPTLEAIRTSGFSLIP